MVVMTILASTGKLAGILKRLRPDIPIKEVNGIEAMELWNKKAEVHPDLLSAEVLCVEPNLIGPMVLRLNNLRWLHSFWAGIEAIMQQAPLLKQKGFLFTRQGGVYASAMTDYVVGHIVARERNFELQSHNQARKQWLQTQENTDLTSFRLLSELSIGILGLGDIGKHIARSCKSVGMTVWGLVRESAVPNDICDEIRNETGLAELLSSVDYVCNVLPSTDRTRGLLNGSVLQLCQNKAACFINVGRGDVIAEADLVHALENHWLSGAILDVFEVEPLPPSSRLWSLPGVVITPHVSGTSRPERVAVPVAENYDLFMAGKKLKYLVDLDAGY